MNDQHLLEVKNLKTFFYNASSTIKAVDDISFSVDQNMTLGVVGESGCGKSVTALSIMNLVPRGKGQVESGEIFYRTRGGDIVDILKMTWDGREMRRIRGNEISMIFQEPMTSLNPVITIGKQLMEVAKLHLDMNKKESEEKAREMLELVGISNSAQQIHKYPHELSGGMRQRVMIAIALICNPSFLIADEPTTALDVTIEAQILRLIRQLQEKLAMAVLIITHDMGVIGEMADEVVVMYAGQIMEKADTQRIFEAPLHPYTQGLLNSIPRIGRRKRLVPITGSVPRLDKLPPGCPFGPRCPHSKAQCKQAPAFTEVEPNHFVRCWYYE